MHLINGGKIIELRVFDEVQDDCMRQVGVKPGIFPDKIIVKRRNKDGVTEEIEYEPRHDRY